MVAAEEALTPGRHRAEETRRAGPARRRAEELCRADPVRRGVGVAVLAVSLGYLGWAVADVPDAPWLFVPFLLANAFLVTLLGITVVNNWQRRPPDVPEPAPYAAPHVAVLVPTCNEPPAMLRRTLESVLDQRWPHDRLVVVVGDDGHRPAIRAMVEDLARRHPAAVVRYHLPPRRGAPDRRGSAKDGNLNSMLALVEREHPTAEFVETRDADDLVGDPDFLRLTVGRLVHRPDVAFVQTVKDATVSRGDPFGNRRRFFYRGIMLSRDRAGSVFPCGSGLVWRRSALERIGGFPTWNLVEDLYSGYVALQHGLRGEYLPVAGAVGQIAPEDVPNVYKQLGTWALDTLRIFFWRSPVRAPGLTARQRLQFLEMGLFYLSSLPSLVLMLTPALCLLSGVRMFQSDAVAHFAYSVLYLALIGLHTFVLGNGVSWQDVLRAKQIWVGLTFVYANACVQALRYGPHRKPVYRVTRKEHRAGIYLRQVAPQIALFLLLGTALAVHLARQYGRGTLDGLDLGSIFWVLNYGVLLLSFIRLSWFGVRRPERPAADPVRVGVQET
ncbi:glycosyltransferase [Actinomadura kijaniata]|uniref:glycosyltransferase n=1 Tax=Actinomadura kijaniata TaxID=46161 RepID=UPI003F1E2FEE